MRLKLVCSTQWSVPSGSGCIIRDNSGDTIFAVNANYIDIGAINQFGFDASNTGSASGVRTQCNLQNGQTGNCSTSNSIHVLGNYFHDFSTAIGSCEVNPNGHPAIQMGIHHGPYMTDAQVIGNRITNIGKQSQSKLNGGSGCQTNYGMYIETQGAVIQNNVIVTRLVGVFSTTAPPAREISRTTPLVARKWPPSSSAEAIATTVHR